MMHTILITGANRGIGFEMTKQYFQQGWEVLACCRDISHAKDLYALANSSNGQIKIFQLEVTDENSVRNLAQQIKEAPIDILMNNAGVYGPSTNFGSTSALSADWLEVLKVNTIAPLRLVETLIKNITESKLKIVANISSNMGSITEITHGQDYIYRTSKAALNMITKSLAIDLKKQGVTVVSLHPGWVQTAMGGANAPITPETSVQGIIKVLNSLTLKDTGSFRGFDGTPIAW